MMPSVYVNEIVVPTAKEFLAARGDRRRAYLACIAAFHTCDYVRRADQVGLGVVRSNVRVLCQPAFDIVDGICNGSKHCGRDHGEYQHQPGCEHLQPAFGFGPSGAPFGQGVFGFSSLKVQHGGQTMHVDACLQTFLISFAQAYPLHFGSTDLAWVDAAYR